MSMYNNLLISAGGGIISRNQQAEQANAATICIGLGGTGISCLKTVKQEVFDRIKPDSTTDGTASYRHIKFLAVDSDPYSVELDRRVCKTASSLDVNTEFFNISNNYIHHLIAAGPALKARPHLKWLKVPSVTGDSKGIMICEGMLIPSGVRQLGRLLLFGKAEDFVNKVQSMIYEAIEGLDIDSDINIHIFTGLGGGTGSGIFLDACYLVRYAVELMNVPTPSICGYFFTPDVNISRISEVNTQKHIKANGYAALKELDHCMSYDTNGDRWHEDYGTFTVESTNPPVDLAHLVSSRDTEGYTYENAYDRAMHVVADYVMEFIVGREHEDGTLRIHVCQIRKQLIGGISKMSGGTYCYCALGASAAYLPYKEITTYLSAKIFEKFAPLKDKLPTWEDIEKIAQNIQIKYEDLNNAIRINVPEVPFYDIDKREVYNEAVACDEDTIPLTLTAMLESMQPVQGELATNEKGMIEGIVVGSGIKKAPVINRIKDVIRKYAEDSNYGPYYAAAVLHTDVVKDLGYYIDVCMAQNDVALNQEICNLTLRKQEWDQALYKLKNAGIFSRRSAAQNYAEAVYAYFDCKREIFVHKSLARVLKTLRTQMDDLYNSYYGPFVKFMRNLEETFADNLAVLSDPSMKETSYAKPIVTIQQLQQKLDETAEGFEYAGLVTYFVRNMLDNNADAWREKNEEKIAVAVSNFFLDVFSAVSYMSMMDYLKIRFGKTDPAQVAQATYNDIILPLSQSVEPLFWVDGAKFSVASSVKKGFCTVPQAAAPVVAAAQQIEAADYYTTGVRTSCSTERISFVRLYCGIPMFAYGGIDQCRLEMQYPGTYLHEAAPNDFSIDNPEELRDNRKWAELVPFSLERNPSDALKKNAENYDRAFELGIVKRNYLDPAHTSWDYRVYRIKKAELDASLEAIESACNFSDLTKVKEALYKYQAYRPALEDECFMSFKRAGTFDYEDDFNKDIVLSSAKCVSAINEAIEGFEKYEAALKKLEDRYKVILYKYQNINNFIDALATGLIKKDNPYTYVYVDNSKDSPIEHYLTDINDDPYGRRIPLYNAFLKYEELSDDIKKSIQDEAKNKRLNEAAAVAKSETALKEELTDNFFDSMLIKSKHIYPEYLKEITEFVVEAEAAVNLL